MSLGIVIANIAAPLRQSPVGPAASSLIAAPAASGADAAAAGASTANETVLASSVAAGSQQLASGFTVVVLQLLNEQGIVTSTIPSAQQLAAYRAGTAVPQS